MPVLRSRERVFDIARTNSRYCWSSASYRYFAKIRGFTACGPQWRGQRFFLNFHVEVLTRLSLQPPGSAKCKNRVTCIFAFEFLTALVLQSRKLSGKKKPVSVHLSDSNRRVSLMFEEGVDSSVAKNPLFVGGSCDVGCCRPVSRLASQICKTFQGGRLRRIKLPFKTPARFEVKCFSSLLRETSDSEKAAINLGCALPLARYCATRGSREKSPIASRLRNVLQKRTKRERGGERSRMCQSAVTAITRARSRAENSAKAHKLANKCESGSRSPRAPFFSDAATRPIASDANSPPNCEVLVVVRRKIFSLCDISPGDLSK